MASDLSSGCTETIDILDDEKEEGEISLEDVSSSEEGGVGHLTSSYVISRRRQCAICKSMWSECASWCTAYRSKNPSKRDPLKGKENRHHIKETGCALTKHTSTLQEKNDDLVPISSDSDMEIVGLTDTSNRSKTKTKIRKKKKKNYDNILTSSIDDLISPASVDLSVTDFSTLKTHYRDLSPPHRTTRSRIISKSPIRRYRSPVRTRSPGFRSSRSPLNYPKSPIRRRSPRRLRSPKQSSPYRSSTKTISKKPPRSNSPSSARFHTDRHGEVTRLLKKVKRLDSVGVHASESNVSRSKEHQPSSLKEKLFNMLRKIPNSKNDMKRLKEKSKAEDDAINDADDEEDLALLRQKALETKQKKSGKSLGNSADAKSDQKQIAKDDDQDVEALQLRMIALRSAVMKKHQNRVQRGIRTNKKKLPRSESPFNQSFLDDIPVPADELLKFASPPCTPPHINLIDSNHTEDMELDTDVEREKEKLPYSPTDKIMSEIPVDTTLLGIDPSDVSFINVNETNSPVFDDDDKRNEQMSLSIDASPFYNNTYLLHAYEAPQTACAYSPSRHNSEIFHSNLNTVQNHLRDYHSDHVECDLLDGICCQSNTYLTDAVPMHEKSNAMHTLPATSDTATLCNLPDGISTLQMIEKSNDGVLFANMSSIFRDDKYPYKVRTSSEHSGMNSAGFTGSVSPSGSMITIDDLAETEVELAFDGDKNLLAADILKKVTSCQIENENKSLEAKNEEPLYMQGVSDITEHLNKIPTLINRTLVPAAILKSNKQLQQRLPKKSEIHPTFKSAEMQPVTVDTSTKSDSTFKPIKLQSPKKATPVLTAPIIFDNPNENSENDAVENQDDSPSSKPETASIDNAVTNDNVVSPNKKRKRVKKNRRKSSAQLLTAERDNLCINHDTNTDVNTVMSTVEQKAAKNKPNKNNNENEIQKCCDNEELSNLQSVGSNTQELLSENNVENKDKNDQNISLENEERTKQTKCLQEKSTESCPLTNISNNSDSGRLNAETTKDNATNRRQSVDEDEDELRAILLASLAKRSKATDTIGNSTMSVATSLIETNTQTTAQTMLVNTPVTTSTPVTNSTVAAASKNASEIGQKKTVTTTSVTNNGSKKRVSSGGITSLPKKMMKKVSIPASTKVVNNAKKYQNMMVQRKLNLRKLDNASNNVKSNENVWSNVNAPKTLHTSDTQRFVINLGSDTDSESETEKCRPIVSTVEKPQVDMNNDFEKSVQKFLRDMRKEQEQSTVTKPVPTSQVPVLSPVGKRDTPPVQTDSNKSSSNMHTPLAVRHLPVSQQEEYHRLKQQILEREKLKLQRKIADNNSNKLDIKRATSSPVKFLPLSEKKSMNAKQNQVKSKEQGVSEKSSLQIRKKNTDTTSTSVLNVSRSSPNKTHSTNVAKHTNSTTPQANLQIKSIKRTIPNNLSIRITNEIAPNRATAGSNRTVDSVEKQPVSDKQQHRPALRALSKEEINRKYVQVQLKSDAIGRVVTINEKPSVQHDGANASQDEKPINNHDVSVEILEERRNNENSKTSSTFSNMSTILLPNGCTNLISTSKEELDNTMETTISRSQYEADRQQEINCNILPLPPESDDSNNVSRKSDVDAKGNTDDVWNILKKDVRIELDSLIKLSEAEQQRYLRDTEHKLVAKRYTVLDHLAEMSGNLRKWDMEKDLQNGLAAEVKKLKEQLKIAEERLQVQRDRVNSMGPKVSIARQKINAGRRECFKLSKICSTLGNRLVGKSYKLPEAGGQLLSDKLKEVANHTRQFSKKKRSQSSDVPESFYSSLSKETAELSKIMRVKEDLSQEQQLRSDTADKADVAGSKSNISCLRLSSDSDNFLMLESSLDNPQTFLNQKAGKKNIILMNILESQSNEQITPPDQYNISLSIPKLSSTPIERNSEHAEKNHSTDISDPATSSNVSKSLATNLFLCKDNEQRNDKETSSPQLSTVDTTAYTTTTTTTTTTTETKRIVPYVSILAHLKTPGNANPHGILCPYEIMGICRDEDCQFIHQSKPES